MDCAAQSMDPYFARAIHGLHSTCAIHGLRNHTCVKRSCKRRLKPGSKVISLEKGKEVVAYLLPDGEDKGEQVLGEVVLWMISPIRLPMKMQLLDSVRNFTVFTSQENGMMELEESGSFPLMLLRPSIASVITAYSAQASYTA